MSTITTWLHEDDNRVGLWITDPRCNLAFAVSNLGAAISRLGNRIHDEAPGDYGQASSESFEAGYRAGLRKGALQGTLTDEQHAVAANFAAATTAHAAGRPVNLEHVDQFADAMGSDRATYRAMFTSEAGQR